MSFLERALPLIAAHGAGVLAAALVLALAVILRLGWGRAFLVPARWPGRIASVFFAWVAAGAALGLCLLLGPMRPLMSQVRSITSVVGRPAGDLAFRTVADDRPRSLAELRGKTVLINLWATWCPPCRRELPAIDRVQRRHAGEGLVVVTLSNEDRAKLRAFAASHPVATLNAYTDRLGWLDVPGRPLTIVIDRDGVVRECLIGGRDYGELERTVRKYLTTS